MRARLTATVAAGILAATACGTASPSPELTSIGAGLAGPPGLRATVYARGLAMVSALALDAEGRLWVTTAAEKYEGNDGVYVIAGPGATPVKVIADLETPLGLTWYGDSLYVTSIGRVDAYSDLLGTRFATQRRVLTLTANVGENNNIVQAPDGRMLVGISAPCDHCAPASSLSAAIVSFMPDGSDLSVYASGVRAPFGLAYYPGTSDLFVSMNQRDDLGARTPGDWLAVVRQGQDWGFPSCYGQGGPACAGVPKPTAVLDKHAAAGGVAIVTGQLGRGLGTSAIVAEWQVGKVLRVALTRSGSTYSGSVSPFLTGMKNPLPVLTTPDGALLIGDWTTGTIYRIARA